MTSLPPFRVICACHDDRDPSCEESAVSDDPGGIRLRAGTNLLQPRDSMTSPDGAPNMKGNSATSSRARRKRTISLHSNYQTRETGVKKEYPAAVSREIPRLPLLCRTPGRYQAIARHHSVYQIEESRACVRAGRKVSEESLVSTSSPSRRPNLGLRVSCCGGSLASDIKCALCCKVSRCCRKSWDYCRLSHLKSEVLYHLQRRIHYSGAA
jgi:hypothetical protein